MGWGILGAGLVSAGMGYAGQMQTNAMNKDMMEQSEQWMSQMSSTAHQREVADLKAAGLNPILSAGGGGASSPGVSPPAMSSPLQAAASGVPSAVKAAADIAGTASDIQLKRSQAKLAEANANVASKTADEKRPFASMMNDAGSLYDVFHSKAARFLNSIGIDRTNAKDVNWFFGDPATGGRGMTDSPRLTPAVAR